VELPEPLITLILERMVTQRLLKREHLPIFEKCNLSRLVLGASASSSFGSHSADHALSLLPPVHTQVTGRRFGPPRHHFHHAHSIAD
jgi:hypothetical protein